MLGRANKAFEAKKGSESLSSKLPSKPDLAKQLFPSSSPTASSPNGNIAEQFKKARAQNSFGSSYSGAPAATAPTTNALKPRSSNISQPQQRQTQDGNAKAFASLYNASDSFSERPDVIDLTADDASSQAKGRIIANVYIDEDDFSDDANLDLDFEIPSALPALPPQPVSTPKPVQPLPQAASSTLSWSQSSPSHYQPPQMRADTSRKTSLKRPSLEADPAAQVPAAKRRGLPKHWQKPNGRDSEMEEYVQQIDMTLPPFATPAPKPKKDPPWMATASVVKEQKKQLKSQQKKLSEDERQSIVENAHAAMNVMHPHKNSAISLSSEQRHVKDLVCDKNQSVFFTGPAGTGKSVLMRAIIQEMKKKFAKDPDRLAVTASTGLAACNIGGMTLHSFAGIGLGKEDTQTLVKKIRRNPKAKSRWLRTKVLVVDEVSMVDGALFDKLSQIGRIIRNNGRAWGGIQLVITGDFFQLPPVPDRESRDIKFAFEADTWNTSIDHTIGLTEVFRQKDPVFANMLNEMRLGRISDESVRIFKGLSRPLHFGDGLEVTELFPTRNEVDNSNERRLRALPGKVYRYESMDSGEPAIRDKLLQNMMAPKGIELKKGAQVMLIKNMDESLVNGSLGTVDGFMTEATFELTRGGIGDELEHGADDGDPTVKKRIKAFARQLEGGPSGDQQEYPVVRFHAVDGSQRILLCSPEDWKVELPTGEVQASRRQLPLILAWALSIHKAQGQTLERVKVDLGKVFEKGQAYVALSRATTQQGLQVMRFEKHKVMAHPRVVQFYNQLYSAESATKRKKTIPASFAGFLAKPAPPPAPSKETISKAPKDDFAADEEVMAAFG